MKRRHLAYGFGCLALVVACTGGDLAGDSSPDLPPPAATAVSRVDPCTELKSDPGPVVAMRRSWTEISRTSPLRTSTLPRSLPIAGAIVARATPLLDDPPGRVRMVAFWGEPGAREPDQDTPVTFLGVDGRWRKLTVRDLDGSSGYLAAGRNSLSADGSRWITQVGERNVMINLGSGKTSDLMRGSGRLSTWAADSSAVALWSMRRPGVTVFDRAGRLSSVVPIDVGKRQVFLTAEGTVTIAAHDPDAGFALRLTTHAPDGALLTDRSCALPQGYPARRTSVKEFDGRRLLIGALVDRHDGIYRSTLIDTRTGSVIDDVEHHGEVPMLEGRADPGLYPTGINGRPTAIYGIDPSTGDMVRLSRIRPYSDQAGYENHAASQFARTLVFARRSP